MSSGTQLQQQDFFFTLLGENVLYIHNSLAPLSCGSKFKNIIYKLIIQDEHSDKSNCSHVFAIEPHL